MLRKMATVVLAVSLVVLMVGCSTMGNSAPMAIVPLDGLKTTATYDILGPAEGTSTGGYLFWWIPVGVEDKYGAIASGPPGAALFGGGDLMSQVERAALYNAIDKTPGADALIAPRWETVKKNYVIYTEETATVKGKAIRLNESAK
jgi:hypothetical protein